MGFKQYLYRVVRYIIKGVPVQKTTVNILTTKPNNLLKDKKIIVTGASRGLGYFIAKKCIDEGAKVLITGRNKENLKKAKKELGSLCEYIVFDAGKVSRIDLFLKSAEKKMGGKINCLVSNVGISLHEGNFRNVTEDSWDKQMDINLKGNYFLVSKFIQYLETFDDKEGNIVVITSERAKRSDDIPYGLTKIATSSFIQCMASKVISEKIRINGVGPGVTTSDMTGFKKEENLYAEWQAGKRIFIPEEVAEIVNFLLSDISNCINGEIITCNHGRHIVHW